ncbi:MAG: hypothetical protein IK055_09135 [Lachnospiraceae bacterium]|nr:hypothetical protein [Lachnospiraceae bacterium]
MGLTTIKEYYEREMYGVWRDGETVTYELLGPDPEEKAAADKPWNPFAIVGGELVRVNVEKNGRRTSFIVHAYLPTEEARSIYPNGSPFIICLHPIMPKDLALAKGYAVLVFGSFGVASDNTERKGSFYDIYPYGKEESEQTGVLMAWAWGASKVLDAVYAGLDREFHLDASASMVTGVSRCGKATAVCGAFDTRFRMTIPACSGAGGLALYQVRSTGKTYDLTGVGGPASYTYGENEPLSCLQSDAERGWFNDKFLTYREPEDFPYDQEWLPILAMDENRYYFIIGACMSEDWVNAPSMWECYKRANTIYEAHGFGDHLVANFHREGHAVLPEDMELIVAYFNWMYFGMDTLPDLAPLKTSVFAGQE